MDKKVLVSVMIKIVDKYCDRHCRFNPTRTFCLLFNKKINKGKRCESCLKKDKPDGVHAFSC
jgi:hypothetical protein